MCQNQSKANFQRLHQPSLQNHVMFHYSTRLLFLFKSLNLLGLYFQSLGLPPPGLYPPPEPALHHPDPLRQVLGGMLDFCQCYTTSLFSPFSLVILLQTASFLDFSIPLFYVTCPQRVDLLDLLLAPSSAAHSEPVNVNQVSATLVRHAVVSERCCHLHLITSLSVAKVGDDQNTWSALFTTDTDCILKNDHLSQHLSCTVAFDCTVVPCKLIICKFAHL